MKSNILIVIFSLLAFSAVSGCEGILDVQNPNNVLEEDLNNPASASGIANGANGTVARGIGYVYAPYETATDECYWIGSRDAWNQLDKGDVGDFNNEFTDASWPFITEGRYMADKAVTLLEGFDATGRLTNRFDLVRSYLYAALVRVVVGETFSDFVISDKTNVNPPIGENNLTSLFDQAVASLNKAETILNALASGATKTDLQRKVFGLRARAQHSKAVRQLLIPSKTTPSNPYVNAGVADANAALAVMSSDFKWKIDYFSVTLFNELAWELVGRSELQIEKVPSDPVTSARDLRMRADSVDFKNTAAYQDRYSPITVISAREMRLIVAESFLAANDSANARAQLNSIRALTDTSASYMYTASHNIFTAMQHERRANTFLQGRRLMDMYRFGIRDARWTTTSAAYTTPGSLLPVTIIERRANPYYQ